MIDIKVDSRWIQYNIHTSFLYILFIDRDKRGHGDKHQVVNLQS